MYPLPTVRTSGCHIGGVALKGRPIVVSLMLGWIALLVSALVDVELLLWGALSWLSALSLSGSV